MAETETQPGALPLIERAAAPLRRKVLDALRTSIVEGRLAPGSRLIERELIDMLGVSRTVVREALRQLESEGLIDVVPNKGAVVRELTLAEANDLYAIRAVLEGLAARLFALNASRDQVAALEAALVRTIEAYRGGDPAAITAAKNAFYDVLFRGSASPTLGAMIGALDARMRRWRTLGLRHAKRSSARSRQSVTDLKGIVAAIRRRDGDRAEALARQDVVNAAAEIARLLNESANGAGEFGRVPPRRRVRKAAP